MSLLRLVILIFSWIATRSLAEPLSITSEMGGIPVGKSLSFFEDKSAQMKLDAILKLDPDAFQPSNGSVPNFGFSLSAVWSRFTLHNPGSEPQTLFLEIRYPSVDIVDFYYPDQDGGYAVKLGGDQRPGSMRDVAYRLPSFRIELPPGTSTFYLRIQSEGSIQLPFHIWTPDLFHDMRVKESAFLAFLYGFLVVMVLYNSFLAISIRSWSHVFYVFFILNSLFHFLGMQGLFFFFVPDRLGPWMANTGFMSTAGITVLLACLFSRSFLDLRIYSQKLYWLLTFTAAIGATVIGITQVSYGIGSRLSALSGILTPLMVLTASVYCCLKKFRPAYFFTVAWIFTIIGYFCYVLAVAGVVETNDLSSWGPFLGVSFEVVMISLALGDKLHLQQELSKQQIRDLNDNLEKKVEEKTRDIRSILANIRLGILSIVSPELRIDKEYSASMETIFHERQLEGKKALDILFRDADLPRDVLSTMESALIASIGENAIAMEANMDCFVREVRLKQGDSLRIIELDWNPMHTRDDITEKILVTARDVTEIHEYQQAMQVQRKELEYISELIKLTQDKVAKFFATAHRFLDENQNLIMHQTASMDILKTLFVNMHTLKGAARSLGLKDLAALCHDVEQYFSTLQSDPSLWDQTKLLQEHAQLDRLIRYYEDINDNKLNRKRSDSDSVSIARQEILDSIRTFDELIQQPDLLAMRDIIQKLRMQAIERVFEPADVLLKEILEPLPKLARDLGKEEPAVELAMLPVSFTQEASNALRYALVHIIRNAMDHGLEKAVERRKLGKSDKGRITLVMEDRGELLTLMIRDDGRGLALRKIEQIAIARNLIPRDHQLSHQEIANLIFESSFTTSQTITDLSGRGVGMNAVKSHIEALQGKVHLQIETPGYGPLPQFVPFRLLLAMPAKHFRRLEQPARPMPSQAMRA